MKQFLYERLVRSLLIELSSGIYSENTPFLPIRRICEDWSVGQKTVDRALSVLVGRGILRGSNRSRYRLTEGAILLAHLALKDFPAHELPPPHKWREQRQLLAGSAKVHGAKIAAIIDRNLEYQYIQQSGLPAAMKLPIFRQGVERYYLLSFFQSLTRSLAEAHFYLDDGSAAGRADILRQISADGIDGVVIFRRSHVASRHPLLAELKKRNLPVVTVMQGSEELADYRIDFNNIAAGFEAMRVLGQHGHRRIWILASDRTDDQYAQRSRGALHFIQQQRDTDDYAVATLNARETEMAALVAKKWRAARHKPTALLATGVHFFIRSAGYFRSKRIRAPRDISVIGFAIPELVPRPFRHLCLMKQNFSELGNQAADAILRLVAGEPVPSAITVEVPYLPSQGKRTSVKIA